MTFKNKTACVFGGTGFLGTTIIEHLAKAGYQIKIASRTPQKAYNLRVFGDVGQIVPVFCDYSENHLEKVIRGSDLVINCIGILYERRKGDFKRLHTELPGRIAKYCTQLDVSDLIHISALGVERSVSRYADSKYKGEEAVQNYFPKTIIFRPSVIFGPKDNFFNFFARMASIAPALPLIGGGTTKFQPVYVSDIAKAVMRVTDKTQAPRMRSKIYELGGPEIVSFKEIYDHLFKVLGYRKPLIYIPFWAASIQGTFLSILPNPPLTADQVESLKTDNVVMAQEYTFSDLNLIPTSMSQILPEYLAHYKKGGRFADKEVA